MLTENPFARTLTSINCNCVCNDTTPPYLHPFGKRKRTPKPTYVLWFMSVDFLPPMLMLPDQPLHARQALPRRPRSYVALPYNFVLAQSINRSTLLRHTIDRLCPPHCTFAALFGGQTALLRVHSQTPHFGRVCCCGRLIVAPLPPKKQNQHDSCLGHIVLAELLYSRRRRQRGELFRVTYACALIVRPIGKAHTMIRATVIYGLALVL